MSLTVGQTKNIAIGKVASIYGTTIWLIIPFGPQFYGGNGVVKDDSSSNRNIDFGQLFRTA